MSSENPPPANDPQPTNPEHAAADAPTAAAAGDQRPATAERLPVGHTIYDLIVYYLLPLLLKPKTGIPILIGAVAVVIAYFVFLSHLFSYETEWFRIGGSPAPQSAELKQCFAKARQLDKPYVIEAIAYLVQYDTDKEDGHSVIRDNRRLIYTIRALRDIKLEEKVFEEGIHSHITGNKLARWHGNEKEVVHDPSRKEEFNVYFAMNEGDIRNIVTGANFTLPLPLEDRSEWEEKVPVRSNENFEGYGNGAGDIICELDIVVESKTLQIAPVRNAAKRLTNNVLKDEEARLNYDASGGSPWRSISARWKNVMPQEAVGIHFSWPQQ